MNYYEHHIGDYAEATSHLSILEDGVYSRLIRKYYARERPLPPNLKEAQRLVGAKSKAERAAVEKVLREFFELREDGWHNERCDEDIVRYLEAEPEREARRVNEALRLKRHREERAQLFNELHAAGHAPPWNTGMAQLRALHSLHCASPATPPATPETRFSTVSAVTPATAPATPATATQSPVPSPHTPDTRSKNHSQRERSEYLPGEVPAQTRAGAVCVALKDAGLLDGNPAHPSLHALLVEGAEVAEFVAAAREAIAKGKGFAYVLATVRGRRADAARSGSTGLQGALPAKLTATEELLANLKQPRVIDHDA